MTTPKTTGLGLALIFLSAAGCGSNEDAAPSSTGGKAGAGTGGMTSSSSGGSSGMADGAKGGGAGTVASGGSGGAGRSGGGSAGKGMGGSSTAGTGGGQVMGIPSVPGEPCNSVKSDLPSKPCMVNVTVQVNGNAADIHFDPVDGAADYRVYELPADKDITVSGDNLSIKNAVYRCAGKREAAPVTIDGATPIQSGAVKTFVDGQNVNGYTRSLDEATLGYVSAVPGDGLVPVYALGESDASGDNSCYFMRWAESRVKHYVTSDDERQQLLEQAYRDDGIVFYVPASDADGTRPVYLGTDDKARYYFIDGPEASARKDAEPAFSVFTDADDTLVPLMRVFYQNDCGRSHDELLAGKPRFERARSQGDSALMNDLHWSGLTGATILVIEALADGCPNLPGLLAPFADPSYEDEFGNTRLPWLSVDDAKALSPAGELYINGQFDEDNQPRPIARAFAKVKPAERSDLDWFEGFDDPDVLAGLQDIACGAPINCNQEFRQTADFGEVHFLSAETNRHAVQSMFGELWVMYNDVAADTPGKFRLTAGKTAALADDSYLYATMDVSAFTTARRYPQIIISDQMPPVQWNLVNGRSLVIQTFGDWPYKYEVELCDHRTWDVNNQCPRIDLYHYYDGDDVKSLAPNAEVGEHTGIDRTTHFEVWVSSARAYLYLDGAPYGCVDLPAGAPGAGPATVTFGDTLYHSGVDALDWFTYMHQNLQYDSRRHYDNLGFKSGVAAPAWDESRLPCVSGFAK